MPGRGRTPSGWELGWSGRPDTREAPRFSAAEEESSCRPPHDGGDEAEPSHPGGFKEVGSPSPLAPSSVPRRGILPRAGGPSHHDMLRPASDVQGHPAELRPRESSDRFPSRGPRSPIPPASP